MGNVPFLHRNAAYAMSVRLTAGDHVGMTRLNRAFRTMREAANQIGEWINRGIVVHVLDIGLNTSTEAGRKITLDDAAQYEGSVLYERLMGRMGSPRMKAIMASRPTR